VKISARRTAAIFNERYPDKHISRTYVVQLVTKFKATGSVTNLKRNQLKFINKADQIKIMG